MKKIIFAIVAALTLSFSVPQTADAIRVVWNGHSRSFTVPKHVTIEEMLDLFWNAPDIWEIDYIIYDWEYAGCDGWA